MRNAHNINYGYENHIGNKRFKSESDQLVAGLNEVGQDLRHVLLVGRDVLLHEAIEAQQQQAMAADQPGHQIHQ